MKIGLRKCRISSIYFQNWQDFYSCQWKREIKLKVIVAVAHMWHIWFIYKCIWLSYEFSMLGLALRKKCPYSELFSAISPYAEKWGPE